jgi:hypothetical protein
MFTTIAAHRPILVALFGCALLALLAGTVQAELITNGDFETGDFTGWTKLDYCNVTTSAHHAGAYGATFNTSSRYGTLVQSVPTVPGESYILSFWLDPDPHLHTIIDRYFTASWDGTAVVDLRFATAAEGWKQYSITCVATQSTTEVRLWGKALDDMHYPRLDDVSVTPVPEPSSIALLGIAAIGLSTCIWRRKRSA